MISIVASIGRYFLNFVETTGRLFVFFLRAFYYGLRPPFYGKQILRQFIDIGYYSLPVVGLTALFSGMVIVLQTYSGFSRFSAESSIPTVVVLSLVRELGPVLAGLMVAGRIGASMAAEIGTMRVTEQIDALTTMQTNPFRYLVMPRIFAGALVLPMLVLVADLVGVFGGYLTATYKLGFNPANYMSRTIEFLEVKDVISGLVKAGAFGLIVSTMGCYHGYNSKGGAQGVGMATTNAVVSASMLILITNYVLTAIFFTTPS